MMRISELPESVGRSRATLLYYEKLGLLRAARQANGYRVYSDADRERLHTRIFQRGGRAGRVAVEGHERT
ncbi:MAG TPA: MerR family transcriptional regulator [Amaricoccus sp.]|uniref:MerR family transcriptional regulator n=1 Tax=Amaricoccus sp. TaxID=1872485 RepID=UPI002BF1FBE7|nr:MerR family transcriptional regulator [Amaricoccus sp.]HMQ92927.1 MerR family transcriptional regulator [Amaricoccus sp.]HMR12754.1 MerR family transcriptional regulator [Arachnia sp.]HMR52490.1 MerR family transcriptional regulator [Amaricoccus sp.]HMT99354.1 MerR family transcriptional regulator [Amaricoccus sp.]